MAQINFDARTVDPSTGGMDIFETGEYGFQIVKSDVKQTRAGDGTMLVLEAACIDEGFTGKRLLIRLNVQNPSPQAVEIAYRDLSAICHVCGVLQITDTVQLHGRPFRVRLEKLPRRDKPEQFTNEIRAYLDMQGNPPTKGQAAGGSAPPAAAPPSAPPAAPAAASQPPAAPPAAAPPSAPPAAPAAAPAAPPAAPPAAAPAAAPAPEAAGAAPPWQQQAAPAAGPTAGAVPPWQQQ